MLDETYFARIDSHDKAQLLGFLYADGCVHISHAGQHTTTISLAKQDKDYLEILRQRMGCTNPFTYRDRNTAAAQDVCTLRMTSQQLATDLIALGCTPRKTFTLQFPTSTQVPPEYLSSFLLGYFEGDGCLYIAQPSTDHDRIVGNAEFSITSTHELCEGYGEVLKRVCGITYRLVKRHKTRANNNYTLKILGNQQILKVMAYLYSGCTFRMERKWVKWQDLIRLIEQYETRVQREREDRRRQAMARPRKGTGTVFYIKRRSDGMICEVEGKRRFEEMVGLGSDSLARILSSTMDHPDWVAVSPEEVASAHAAGTVGKTYAA
jgi:hypothetical protein